jgi:hypothetical protein
MATPQRSIPAMVSVYDGRECVGFILRRRPGEFESFTAAERSVGIFSTQAEAAAVLGMGERG